MGQSAEAFLADHELLTLATSSKSGEPHACSVFYATDGTTVYFSVAPGSQSHQNLSENARGSIAVGDAPDEGQDASAARGIQITGDVVDVHGDEEKQAGAKVAARYPYLGDVFSGGDFFRLDPTEIHYVHNDEDGDESFSALGVEWKRETVK
jgi:uncharacterized protein YhbP (UPF0306 family)